MRKKPFIFTLISILCLIEPLIKIFYFRALTHFDYWVIIKNLSARESFFEVIDFWLVFPIAGLLILKLRKFNYFAFMGILSYIIYSIVTYEEYTWPYNSDSPFFYNYALTVCSLMVFIYFLLPGTRKPFFDARVRWWEPMQRYSVHLPCFLSHGELTFSAHILNISKSGVFIDDSPHVKVGDRLRMNLSALGVTLDLELEVMNKHLLKNQMGFGAKFRINGIAQDLKLRSLIRKIKRAQAPTTAVAVES